jgi:tetratricopeptide (TPR) repeat protein
MLDQARPFVESTDDVQNRSLYAHYLSLVLRQQGDLERALAAAEVAVQSGDTIGAGSPIFKQGIVDAIEAALDLGDLARAEAFLEAIERRAPGEASPMLRAHGLRLRARLAPDEDQIAATERLSAAAGIFRDVGMPFWLAVTLLEQAEWLVARGRAEDAAPMLDEAREIFERLEARPFIIRVAGLANRETVSA